MTNPYYTNTVNLPSEMFEFGKYTLKYEPPASAGIEPTVSMSISSEANLTEMLDFFQTFLKASGYYIADNQELTLDSVNPITFFNTGTTGSFSLSDQSFWEDDGFSLTGNPLVSNDTLVIGSRLPSGVAEDFIKFG
jgi:hypothetical protein